MLESTVSLTFHNLSALQAKALLDLGDNDSVAQATVDTKPAEEAAPVKRKRRTKAEMEEAALADDGEPEALLVKTIVEEKPESKAARLSFDKDLLPVLREYNRKHGKEKFVKALARFGVKTARDIPTDAYAAAIKAFKV